MADKQRSSNPLGSIFLILLAVIMIARTSRDIAFYFNKSVVTVNNPADVEKLRDNANAEIRLGLDFKQAHAVSYLSQREFLLIPFSGVGYRLMYVIEGPLTDKLVTGLQPPYKGRVVAKDLSDSWRVYDKRMKLKSIFARDRITIPDDAMLVYDAPKKFPNLWVLFLFGLAIAYLLFKAYSLVRFLRQRNTSQSGTGAPPVVEVSRR
jgi:hypothetical protein